MAADPDALSSLRHALAAAERARDEALAQFVAREERWKNEHREEQHRLRNMFSVIRTVARRTAEDVETVEEYRGVLDGRLRSYLAMQAALARDWSRGTDLALLVAGELLPFDLQEGAGVELSGPSVSVTSRAAGLLALAFHEFASAKILSGAVGGDGSLKVRWHLDGDDERFLLIDWIENIAGPGDGDDGPSSRMEWVGEMIAHQLSGTMTRNMEGAERYARLRLPPSVICPP